jgi:hypothetical protein
MEWKRGGYRQLTVMFAFFLGSQQERGSPNRASGGSKWVERVRGRGASAEESR